MRVGPAVHRRVAALLLGVVLLLGACSAREPTPPQPSVDPPVNVADFGAVGDGATDDRPAIQAAFDHAGSTGATIYFPAGTFRLATASAPVNRILITQANQNLVGAGEKVSRLLVGASFGNYVTVIGAAHDSLGTGSWSMRDLAIDQNARSNNGLDVPGMEQSPKMALRLGDYARNSQIAVSRSAFSDSDSVNTLYLYAAMVSVASSNFTRIGGPVGLIPHDHSTIYTTATSDESTQQISGNSFSGVRSSGGSATAIETHGGIQLIIDNVISDYLRGFNVTGVAEVRTMKATVSRNVVNRAAIGVQLWSQTSPAYPSPGLANVELNDNVLGLDGAAWQIAGLMAPTAGVLLTTSNSAPVDGMSIARNKILYASANLAAQVRASSAGISCQVAAVEARPKRVVIVENVIGRAPSAIDGACVVDGALVRSNEISS